MTKAEMMEHFDGVLTDRRLSRARIEDKLAKNTREEPIPLFDEYVCHASGFHGHRAGLR